MAPDHDGKPSALDLARDHVRDGRHEAAATLCRRLLEHPGSAAGARHLLGLIAFANAEHVEAVANLEAALQLEPAHPDWHYDLGVVHAGQGDSDAASACFRRAIELDPQHLDAHNNLGAVLLQGGHAGLAAQCLQQALSIDPENPRLNLNLGSALLALGRGNEAIERLRHAVTLVADDPAAHFNLANALRSAGDLEEAASGYRQCLALDPRHARSHYALAEIHHERGQWEPARAGYEQAITLAPSLLEAHANLAIVLRETGRLSEAVTRLRQALELAPESAYLRRTLRETEGRGIPAWHFPMLGDEARNDAYRRAIEQVVRPGQHVLDIGTGTGLLAMMAARAGAASVIACEAHGPIAEVAARIVADNGLDERIRVIAKRSTALRPGIDVAVPVNVIVSEIVDVGLLGEGVLPALRHALRNLAAADAISIPRAARVLAELVELPDLRKTHPLTRICDFDLRAFNRFQAVDEYRDVHLHRHRHRRLTTTATVARITLDSPPPHVPDAEPRQTSHSLAVAETGTAHAVAFWFELELAEGIVLSNCPGSELTAWGQAVQFLEQDVPLQRDERVQLRVLESDSRIAFSL